MQPDLYQFLWFLFCTMLFLIVQWSMLMPSRITSQVMVKSPCKRPHLQLHLLLLYLGMLWLLVHNRTMWTVGQFHPQPQLYHPEWSTMSLQQHQLCQAVYCGLVWSLEMVSISLHRAITFQVSGYIIRVFSRFKVKWKILWTRRWLNNDFQIKGITCRLQTHKVAGSWLAWYM